LLDICFLLHSTAILVSNRKMPYFLWENNR
jgi:hypothetical protein